MVHILTLPALDYIHVDKSHFSTLAVYVFYELKAADPRNGNEGCQNY